MWIYAFSVKLLLNDVCCEKRYTNKCELNYKVKKKPDLIHSDDLYSHLDC